MVEGFALVDFEYFSIEMERGKQVANSTTEKWKMKENRDRVVKRVTDELINHVSPNLKFSLPELVQRVIKYEEKVYASVKTEEEYLRGVAATSKSICARSWKDDEALLTSASASGTNANIDWQENVYEKVFAMPIGSSPRSINQPSISKGPDDPVQQQTSIALEAFGTGTKSNTQRISPLIKESDNQNQVSGKPTLDSEEQSPAMQQLINELTSISPEALTAAFGEIEEEVHLTKEVVDELGLPTFVIPEGWKMPRNFVATALDTPSIFGSLLDGFNQRPKIVENQNLLAEIKDINNRLFDCEVVIAEKENVETAVGQAAELSEGLLVQIMYNAVTINQNLVSKFTSDKKVSSIIFKNQSLKNNNNSKNPFQT
ncbi:hypothetical protein L195_g015199 [Trifolium pratense]|uniref:Mediator of RNA polymerase II transcription subunit 15a-like protein n=1 Tax=Trifolium pratense TaxID=57577 RepID=A0A2K3MMQ3_TRIPR|nr:hypothetical protein L195_g015199 [Trifolium pratense]